MNALYVTKRNNFPCCKIFVITHVPTLFPVFGGSLLLSNPKATQVKALGVGGLFRAENG